MAQEQPAFKDQTDALFAQGQEAIKNGLFDQAVEIFRRVLHVNIDHQESHYQLGLVYMNTGDMESAIDHFQSSVAVDPAHIQSWINLAYARIFAQRFKEALTAARMARRLAGPERKNEPMFVKMLANCIQPMTSFETSPSFVEEVTVCFQSPDVNKTPIVDVAQKILLQQPVTQTLLEKLQTDQDLDFDSALKNPALNWPVFSHDLFVAMLSKTVIWDPSLETLFTYLRARVLESIATDKAEESLWAGSLRFVAALAQQCWLNDHLYNLDTAEREQLGTVEARVQDTMKNGESPSPYDVAILACYKPLCGQDYADSLLQDETLKNHESLADVIRIQIAEPREEQRIKDKELEELTTIDDEVSLLVKEQYETFPYPRWIDTTIDRPVSVADLLQKQFPHLDLARLGPISPKPSVLVAGCGTGRQSVENAMLIRDAQITAIDLTASSLAYGIRKTKELGLQNIRYGLADILRVKELGQSFDLVICGGVLHHMKDPMAGWQALYDVTEPVGFMSIALYSEIARRYIVEGQDYIKQQNITNDEDGIREFRAYIKGLPDSHSLKRLIGHRDFYSVSECRDLLFHVQEHRFTALSLEQSINTLGLEFLGFQNLTPEAQRGYQIRFPDDPGMINLKNWHEYETDNPMTFRGMYQFWAHKPKT